MITEVQHLETSLEEGALQPRSNRTLILQQESGRVVSVPLVSLSRTYALDNLKLRNFHALSIGRSFFDHSRAHRGVRQLIDQNEAPCYSIVAIRIKEQRNVSFKFN